MTDTDRSSSSAVRLTSAVLSSLLSLSKSTLLIRGASRYLDAERLNVWTTSVIV